MINKIGAKLLSDLAIFSIFFSDILLHFQESVRVGLLKYLMYFFAGITSKYFQNIPEEKYIALLRILNLFIKFFVNRFVDIVLTF